MPHFPLLCTCPQSLLTPRYSLVERLQCIAEQLGVKLAGPVQLVGNLPTNELNLADLCKHTNTHTQDKPT